MHLSAGYNPNTISCRDSKVRGTLVERKYTSSLASSGRPLVDPVGEGRRVSGRNPSLKKVGTGRASAETNKRTCRHTVVLKRVRSYTYSDREDASVRWGFAPQGLREVDCVPVSPSQSTLRADWIEEHDRSTRTRHANQLHCSGMQQHATQHVAEGRACSPFACLYVTDGAFYDLAHRHFFH